MDFPQSVSLTITNVCNLRCRMCGQWSDEGYMRQSASRAELGLTDWKRVVDEVADHGLKTVIMRGGEVFLYPDIIPLLEHIRSKGIFAAIDTNGTQLGRHAADLVRIGNLHLTVSVDGPEEIHDAVRGVRGTFQRVRESLARLADEEAKSGTTLSKSITFTVSPYSYRGLGALPDVARSLGMGSICVVAYYYFPEAVGKRYEEEMRRTFGCEAYSWRGFHHEQSGVDIDEFLAGLRAYRAGLRDITDYPYFPMTEEEYRIWFTDPVAPVGEPACANAEKLIDIQPSGNANFCVDFPDYIIGNVRKATIEELWNSPQAGAFRDYRRNQPLAVCHRCGAKYMAQIRGAV